MGNVHVERLRHFGKKSCMYPVEAENFNLACNILKDLYVCMFWRADFRKKVKKAETNREIFPYIRFEGGDDEKF